jgi:hypothetical protein
MALTTPPGTPQGSPEGAPGAGPQTTPSVAGPPAAPPAAAPPAVAPPAAAPPAAAADPGPARTPEEGGDAPADRWWEALGWLFVVGVLAIGLLVAAGLARATIHLPRR